MLWILSLPVPPGTYLRITLTLQFWVTDNVLSALLLLGIPAEQRGNIIQLANTTVGVEEACSVIRSLISCVYAGLFFSASFVHRWPSRVTLVLLAAPLAIVMNFLRSLLLTLLAYRGVDINGFWHDATGFAILGVTAAILGGLALLLDKFESKRDDASATPPEPGTAEASSPGPHRHRRILAIGYTLAGVCIITFALLTRPAVSRDAPPVDLLTFLPADPDGWDLVATQDLYRFSDILETENLAQRTYIKASPNPDDSIQITVYLAYWAPGAAPVSLVASHTPDACWPGSGWAAHPERAQRTQLPLPGGDHLAAAEYRFFEKGSLPQHVWFWHAYDRHVIQEFNPRRPIELLESVLEYGVRSQGDQLFARLSSNRPWEEIRDEPVVRTILANLEAFGI